MFDAYYKWLGIPPKDQPPDHYRLLGLQLFESDVDVIEAAANRQMAYVQQRATGEHAAISQKLLNELSAARVCLLDSKKKVAYDAKLKTKANSPPVSNPPPLIEPQGIERLLAEEREDIFHQAQQAYDVHDYEKAVELLESQPVDDNDPQFQQLLKNAKFSLEEIQRLSQELDLAWKQKNAKRMSQVATELLSIQPSHPAANEAIRWAIEANCGRRRSRWPQTSSGKRLKDEPILRKYLALVVLVFVVVVLVTSVFVYHQLATSTGKPDATLSSQRDRDAPSATPATTNASTSSSTPQPSANQSKPTGKSAPAEAASQDSPPTNRITEVGVLQGHKWAVKHLAFSPDGRFAVSGSDDKTVRYWNLENCREVWKRTGFQSELTGVKVTPDGTRSSPQIDMVSGCLMPIRAMGQRSWTIPLLLMERY